MIRYDVVVVGAGPAGSAAAYHLARRGRRVLLLDQARLPRDKACGDALTQRAVRALTEMGVIDKLAQWNRVRGARVHMRDRGSRDFLYDAYPGADSHSLVVPRTVLDHAICETARSFAAECCYETPVLGPIVEHGRVVGVRALRDGAVVDIRASAVVAADGARSPLACAAGLREPSAYGVGIRGYFTDVGGPADLQEVFLALDDAAGRKLLPSFGWVNPLGNGEANIGVGVFASGYGGIADEILQQLLTRLQSSRAEFGGRLRGELLTSTLPLSFSAERCVGDGILLVGDAAGLVNPFTGEGVSYALESGRIAAEVIDRGLTANAAEPDLLDYALLLEHSYSGLIGAGRRSASRYQFVWRVLESTFDSRRPPFSLCRRAVLLPEGLGELRAHHAVGDVAALVASGADVHTDLLGVGELMTSAVRDEWPFLARLVTSGRGHPGVPFRPALLLLLAAMFGESEKRRIITLGAAVELSALAALAQLGVDDAAVAQPSWGNRFAVLVSDLLMAKSLHLASAGGSEALTSISRAVTDACAGRVREYRHAYAPAVTEEEHLSLAELQAAPAFELPCRLGAVAAAVEPHHVQALEEYGRALGVAFRLTEDVRILTGQSRLAESAAVSALTEGTLAFPVLIAQTRTNGSLSEVFRRPDLTPGELEDTVALIAETGAFDLTLDVARRHGHDAVCALQALPDGPPRKSLHALVDYALTREVPARPDLASALE